MNTQLILHYLTELSNHNEREWYHAHKAEYREANAEFEALVQDLILKIGKFDSSVLHNQPKDLTFKLVGTPGSAMTNPPTIRRSGPTFPPWGSCRFRWGII